jgi:hypothetical protein
MFIFWTHLEFSLIFSCGAAGQIQPRPPRFDISRSHAIRHMHTVGLSWKNDQSVAGSAIYSAYNKHKNEILALSGIRTRDSSNQGTADLRLWLYTHWDNWDHYIN